VHIDGNAPKQGILVGLHQDASSPAALPFWLLGRQRLVLIQSFPMHYLRQFACAEVSQWHGICYHPAPSSSCKPSCMPVILRRRVRNRQTLIPSKYFYFRNLPGDFYVKDGRRCIEDGERQRS
jgi:hypothetical protein